MAKTTTPAPRNPLYGRRLNADIALEMTPILVVNVNGDEVARFAKLTDAHSFINALGLNGRGEPVYFIADDFTPAEHPDNCECPSRCA